MVDDQGPQGGSNRVPTDHLFRGGFPGCPCGKRPSNVQVSLPKHFPPVPRILRHSRSSHHFSLAPPGRQSSLSVQFPLRPFLRSGMVA